MLRAGLVQRFVQIDQGSRAGEWEPKFLTVYTPVQRLCVWLEMQLDCLNKKSPSHFVFCSILFLAFSAINVFDL